MLKFLILPVFGVAIVAITWSAAMPYIATAAETVELVANIAPRHR